MWPRGKAGVCKTLYGGSNPSVTSESLLFNGSQLLRGVFLYAPFFELKAFLSLKLKAQSLKPKTGDFKYQVLQKKFT